MEGKRGRKRKRKRQIEERKIHIEKRKETFKGKERERERERDCHFLCPDASDDTRTRTLDLLTTRQVFYYCAIATGLLGCFLKNAVFFRQSSIGQLIQIEVTKIIELSDDFDEGTKTNGVNILPS